MSSQEGGHGGKQARVSLAPAKRVAGPFFHLGCEFAGDGGVGTAIVFAAPALGRMARCKSKYRLMDGTATTRKNNAIMQAIARDSSECFRRFTIRTVSQTQNAPKATTTVNRAMAIDVILPGMAPRSHRGQQVFQGPPSLGSFFLPRHSE